MWNGNSSGVNSDGNLMSEDTWMRPFVMKKEVSGGLHEICGFQRRITLVRGKWIQIQCDRNT